MSAQVIEDLAQQSVIAALELTNERLRAKLR